MNYIRNAVKATVDAYDGETHLYIFAPDDPIIGAYQHLFPTCSARLRTCRPICGAHARYPETLFRIQAEIYRTYHMLDPQSFYNKEDLWDLARHATGAGRRRRTGRADLRGGHAARREEGRVSADDAVHAAQQGQPDRPDGGALRRRRTWAKSWCCSFPSRS